MENGPEKQEIETDVVIVGYGGGLGQPPPLLLMIMEQMLSYWRK